MKNLFVSALILLFIQGYTTYGQGTARPNSIFMSIPERDTTITASAKYGLSACTLPGSRVTVNGKEYKVYPTGAFAGQVDLKIGENIFSIVSLTPSGDTLKKSFYIVRQNPPATLSTDSLVIEDRTIEPSRDLWLDAGEMLNVRFKGTPGCRATFLNGLEMRELSLMETNGTGGIYQGTCRIKQTDKINDEAISFRLEDKNGKFITAVSKGKISVKADEFPLIALTKGERPFLNNGLGEDRLGGAKLSFLNPGVKLKIVGKAGRQYKVALSSNLQAWIPEDQVEILPKGTYLPYSLTGSWNVYGDDKYDYVSVGLNDRLPYTTTQDPENERIIVDVYGAVSNTNWITQHLTTKEIKNVYYEVPSGEVFRIVIELKHKQNWGYAVNYNGNSLVIKIKRQPESLDFDKLTFILDAGHGGSSLGAVGATGAKEKDINLSTVYFLKELLEDKGAKVILTRKDDSDIPTGSRVKDIINSGADILISIHSNAIGNTSDPEKVKGISTYYKHIAFRPLSTFIYDEVLKTKLEPFGNIGNFNFTLNSPTELPNVLVELAFMSNPEDEMKLMDEDFRRELAKRIVKGVSKFLDYCED